MNEAAILARSVREKRGGEGFAKEVMAKGGFGQQRKPLKECVETKAAVSHDFQHSLVPKTRPPRSVA